MRIKDASDYYGSRKALAEALGLFPSAISNWDERYKGIIPELYAYKLHRISGGRLKVDPEFYRKRAL